jgi:hypothetical protein
MTATPTVRRAALAVAVVLFSLVSLSACSSKKSSSVSPEDAAGTVTAVFSLSTDQQSCLEQQFSDSAAAREVLSGQNVASPGDLRAFGKVEAACIPSETLATSVTHAVSDAFGGTLTDAQQTCLTNGVTALSDDDRNKLLVGLVVSNSGAMDAAGIAELGQVTNGLLELCQLDIATTQTRPVTGDTTPNG